MIRVGFVISPSSGGWTGGKNYFLNLFTALSDSGIVRPVILTAPRTPDEQFGGSNLEVVRSELLDPANRWTLARRVGEKLYGRAFLLESLLRRHGVDLLSHSSHLGPRATLPTIGWIPDFQHRRIPDFFSPKERRDRDRIFGNLINYCTRVVVSSEDAMHDLKSFRPSGPDNARVLNFVSGLQSAAVDEDREKLLDRYNVAERYFFMPNQFWFHKNHATVIDALGLLRQRGLPIKILATGNPQDYRYPDHFRSLMQRVQERGVENDFRVLGLVPLADVAKLMRHAVATINPSLFEGWSTTVEEAKTMGKAVVLSDIPVHREQAPEHAVFFSPKDPSDLAEKLLSVAESYDENVDAERRLHAAAIFPHRIAAFRTRFEDIVREAYEARP